MSDSIKNPYEEQINTIWELYSTQNNFQEVFSLKKIEKEIFKQIHKVYTSEKAPSLFLVEKAYGYPFLIYWLSLQFEEVNSFPGTNRRMDTNQIRELCELVYNKYNNLKVPEILLFLSKIRSGDFGEFFGAVDPLKIMSNLGSFVRERNQILINHQLKENEEQKRRLRLSWAIDKVTRAQYLEMLKNGTYTPVLQNQNSNKQKINNYDNKI